MNIDAVDTIVSPLVFVSVLFQALSFSNTDVGLKMFVFDYFTSNLLCL